MQGGGTTVPRVLMDIPQNRVRVITRVISSMSKVNDELFIEPSRGRCIFRVVNSLRTAHMAVVFGAQFFCDYQVEDYTDGISAAEANIRVPCKYLAAAFRNVGAITSVRMTLESGGDKLIIKTNTIYEGIIKVFEIAFCEEVSDKAEPIQMTGCRFRTRPGQLSETLSNFHAKCENIQFAPSEHLLNIKSDDVSQQNFGGTSICLPVTDLLAYEIHPDMVQSGAKVCEQKYCKAFLMLADACNLDACVSFDPLKNPVLLSTEASDGSFSFAMLISAYEADPLPVSATQLSKSSVPDRGINSTPHNRSSIESCRTTREREQLSSVGSGRMEQQQQFPTGTPNRPANTFQQELSRSGSDRPLQASNPLQVPNTAGSGNFPVSSPRTGSDRPNPESESVSGYQQVDQTTAVLSGGSGKPIPGSITSSNRLSTPSSGVVNLRSDSTGAHLADHSVLSSVGQQDRPIPVPAPFLLNNQNPPLTAGSANSGSAAVLAPATPGAYFQHQQQQETEQQTIKRLKAEISSQGASHGSQYQVGYQQQQQVMQQQAWEHQQKLQQPQQHQEYRRQQEDEYRKQYDVQDNWVPERFTTQVDVSQYVSQVRRNYRVEGDEDVLSESVSPQRVD